MFECLNPAEQGRRGRAVVMQPEAMDIHFRGHALWRRGRSSSTGHGHKPMTCATKRPWRHPAWEFRYAWYCVDLCMRALCCLYPMCLTCVVVCTSHVPALSFDHVINVLVALWKLHIAHQIDIMLLEVWR